MKYLNYFTFSLLLVLFLSPSYSWSQNEVLNKKNSRLWITTEFGVAHNNLDNKSYSGRSFNMNVNCNKGIHLFTLQGSSVNTEHVHKANAGSIIVANFFSQLLGGGKVTAPPPVYTKSKFSEGSLMYGLISRPSSFRFFASSGISWISGHGNYKSDNFSEIGVPLKVGVLFSTNHVGLGINYFKNYNSYSGFSGVAFSIQVGNLN